MINSELPPLFLQSMAPLMGESLKSFISSMESEPSVSIRLNPRKPKEGLLEMFATDGDVSWTSRGHYLKERPNFTLFPEMHQGLFYVQDASSMVYTTILKKILGDDPRPTRLLDLCAAPGGKTTAAIDALPEGSLVVANEFVPSRANILAENLAKWGYPDVIVTNNDTCRFSRLKNRFDIVMVDAPCSGEGMMRKEEMARTQWSEGLVESCALLQEEILENGVAALAPGGFLIYSTCTFNLKENEEMVKRICDKHALMQISFDFIDRFGILPSFREDVKGMRFMPHATRGEGLFVAVMKKEGKAAAAREKPHKKVKDASEEVKKWLLHPADYEIREEKGILKGIRPQHKEFHDEIGKNCRILRNGLPLATIKGKDLTPSHELALSSEFNLPGNKEVTLEFTKEEALRYLAKENMPGYPEMKKGWFIPTYGGYPLGWAKNLGNRSNNHYPSEWRIRNLGGCK